MLCRRHGATAAYTPMLHSRLFLQDPNYRAEHFSTCEGDGWESCVCYAFLYSLSLLENNGGILFGALRFSVAVAAQASDGAVLCK